MSDLPHKVRATLTSLSVSTTRATFLAGYTYYQCGRYEFAPGADSAYVWFFRTSFELSCLTGFIAEFMSYYIHSCADDASKLAFVEKNITYARWVFRLFFFALVFYSLGLSRIGYVYYPAGSPAALIPSVFFCIVPFILFINVMYVVVAHYKVEHLSDEDMKAELTAMSKAGPIYMLGDMEGLVTRVVKQVDTLAGRAVYVAGMAQAGLWSYRMQMTTGPYAVSAKEIAFGKTFLSSACIGLALALIAAMTLSTVSVFVQDLEHPDRQTILVNRLAKLVKYSFLCYFVSFFFLALCILFMPWGCQYAQQASINVPIALGAGLICVSGLVWCLTVQGKVTSMYQNELEEGDARASTVAVNTKTNEGEDDDNFDGNMSMKVKPTAVKNALNDSTDDAAEQEALIKRLTEEEDRFVTCTLNQVNNLGAQGTLASGFVFSNIVSFSDVLRLPYQILEVSNMFLMASVLAICSGLTAAVLDSLLTAFTCQFVTVRERFLFLQSTKVLSKIIEVCFYIGMGSWFLVFGLSGFAKFNVLSSVPAIFAFISILLSIVGSIYMDSAFSWVNIGRWKGTEVHALTEVVKSKLQSRSGVLSKASYNVLFLGGFAYNCVTSFKFQLDAPLLGFAGIENAYVAMASLCFSLSISIITLSANYDIFTTNCKNSRRALDFGLKATPVYKAILAAASLVVLLLIAVFSLIGYVKDRRFYVNWDNMFPVMQYGSVFCAVLVIAFAVLIRMKMVETRREYQANGVTTIKASTYNYKKTMEQVAILGGTSTFVAGNVCYEILFSEAKQVGPLVWESFFYFICNNLTFAFGVITVSFTTLITLAIWEMNTEEEKHMFALKIHTMKDSIFVMSASSLFLWIVGTIFADRVKYSGIHGPEAGGMGISFCLAIPAALTAIYVAYQIKTSANWAHVKQNDTIPAAGSDSAATVGKDVNPLHANVAAKATIGHRDEKINNDL